VTFFNCLHDMGDLVGAARRVRQMPKPGGSWMIVEPAASDRLEDNLNPFSRLHYAPLLERRREAFMHDEQRRLSQNAKGGGNALQHGLGGTTLNQGKVSSNVGAATAPTLL